MITIFILALIGLIHAFSPGFSFILLCCLVTVLLIWNFAGEGDKNFLIFVFLLGFAIRVAAAIFLHEKSVLEGWEGYTSGDERLYWLKIKHISENGFANSNMYSATDLNSLFGTNSLTILGSILYGVLGFQLLVFKFINSFFGALLPIIAYYLSINLFEKKNLWPILQEEREKGSAKKIAMLTSLLVMVFPSLIRWSGSGIKEPLIIFMVALLFLMLIKSQVKLRWYYPPILIFLFMFLARLQDVSAYTALCVFAVSFFVGSHMSKKKVTLLLLGVIISIPILYSQRDDINYKVKLKLYDVAKHQVAQAISDEAGYALFPSHQAKKGPGYRIFPDHIVPPKEKSEKFMVPEDIRYCKIAWSSFFLSGAKGLVYAFFSPFPWSVNSPLQLQAYPQMVCWYMLFPFALFGVLVALRENPRGTFPIILFMFVIGSVLAVSEGNIGGVFRHRDWLTPFYLMFGSVGVIKAFRI